MRSSRLLIISSAGFCAAAGVVAISSPSAASPSSAAAVHHSTSHVLGSVAASRPVSVEIALPLRHKAALNRLTREQTIRGSGHYHQWLNPNQFRRHFGATNAELRTLAHKLGRHGLSVSPAGTQSVNVTGTAATVNHVFSTRLQNVQSANGSVRIAAASPLVAPRSVRRMRGTVIDLSRVSHAQTDSRIVPNNRNGAFGGYWFTDLKQAYQYPKYGTPAQKGANGAGRTIGIVMSSAPSFKDANLYFSHEKLATPKISVVKIDGGTPFDPNSGASVEANLDVQQSGGMAPKAHIIVYDMKDLSDQDIFDAYSTAIDQNKVDVVNSSFGECELFFTAAYNGGQSFTSILQAEHNLYLQAAAQGITFDASSGDDGGLQCISKSYAVQGKAGKFIVGGNAPATDPEVTGVGGTNLVTTFKKGTLDSAYVRENADADPQIPSDPFGIGANVSGGFFGSGSGPSSFFAEPSYQKSFTNNRSGKRETPDVSLHMGGCPIGSLRCGSEDSFVEVFDGGDLFGVVGTSASAPDFAGTIALYDQVHHSRAGAINPTLYRLGSMQCKGTLGYQVFHRNISGNNGHFNTAFTTSGGKFGGWDQVLGNGTLIAKNFIFGTSSTPAAGVPQSPSNP
jgi:subtilase family serine protease